jgi:integrase/recombinase XerC
MLRQAFIDYLQLEKNYSGNTLIAYQKDLEVFAQFLLTQYELNLDSPADAEAVSHKMIRDWMGDLMTHDVGKRSVARKVAAVSSFFKFLQKTGRLKSNPAARVKAPRFEKKLPVFLKEDSVENLFERVAFGADMEGCRDKCILEVLYSCGIRRAELCDLEFRNIDFRIQTIKVLGKGNKERIIPFGNHAAAAMKEYIKACEDEGLSNKGAFFILKSGNKIYPRLVHKIVDHYLSQVSSLSKKSPHVLRHTFATHLLNRGADLNAIKEMLGHKSLAATQVYVHNSISKLKEVYQKAHPKA